MFINAIPKHICPTVAEVMTPVTVVKDGAYYRPIGK